jgi:hypothetical protein
MSLRCKTNGCGKWMKGKHPTEATKERMRRRHVSCKEETKKKISQANRGSNNGFFGKTHSETVKKEISRSSKERRTEEEYRGRMLSLFRAPERKSMLREAAIKSWLSIKRKGFHHTKPEILMESILKALGFSFVCQKPIRDILHKYCCDFL